MDLSDGPVLDPNQTCTKAHTTTLSFIFVSDLTCFAGKKNFQNLKINCPLYDFRLVIFLDISLKFTPNFTPYQVDFSSYELWTPKTLLPFNGDHRLKQNDLN